MTDDYTRLYTYQAAKYADDVLDGTIPANKFIKQACQRFVNDLERDDIYFDQEDIERWFNKIRHMPHIKGPLAGRGESFTPKPEQIFEIANIIGWKVTATGRRRFREAYIEKPRKNGKSFEMSPLAIGFLCWDRYKDPATGEYIYEHGAEVYCGATSREQARKVFDPCRSMVSRSPELMEKYGLEVLKNVITATYTESKMEVLKANPADGDNPSAVICDEYHEHVSNDLVETMSTGMDTRAQPIIIYITTAGSDMGGPCYEKRQECIDILNGVIEDDTVFAMIYTIDNPEQWDTMEAFKLANPNWDMMNLVNIETKIKQARRNAAHQNAYKTKHLNIWVGASVAFFNMISYQACRRKSFNEKKYAGMDAFVGLDLNTKSDFASMAVIIPPQPGTKKYIGFCRHYLPQETIDSRPRYTSWWKQGWVTATPGCRTDYAYIEQDLLELCNTYNVIEVPYDDFQANYVSTRMMDEGVNMVEHGKKVQHLNEPMREFEAIIAEKKIIFSYDPVLLWMMGNVMNKPNPKGNFFPTKEREANKIDGAVAMLMAFSRAWFYEDNSLPDDYELTVV